MARMGYVRLVHFEWSSMSVMPASLSDFDDVVRIKAWIVPCAFAQRLGPITLGIADDSRVADSEVAAFVRMAVNPQVDVLWQIGAVARVGGRKDIGFRACLHGFADASVVRGHDPTVGPRLAGHAFNEFARFPVTDERVGRAKPLDIGLLADLSVVV